MLMIKEKYVKLIHYKFGIKFGTPVLIKSMLRESLSFICLVFKINININLPLGAIQIIRKKIGIFIYLFKKIFYENSVSECKKVCVTLCRPPPSSLECHVLFEWALKRCNKNFKNYIFDFNCN